MLDTNLEEYASETRNEVLELLRTLCVIPSPSGSEDRRAEFVLDWMKKNGAQDAYIDCAKNVIWPMYDDGKEPVTVFMAHTDVVFPDTDLLPFFDDGQRYHCPGVGDDTANLCSILVASRFFVLNGRKPEGGIIIAANSCEEGLGNLRGCRAVVDAYRGRLKRLITVDGTAGGMVTRAVGSHRYRVTVRTEGGHSYGAFGNRNAIACLASIIGVLYDVKVPQKPGCRTTYNVGQISGGTSVNTIAQEASMLYEYRSDDRECLDKMKNMFFKIVDAYRSTGIEIDAELLGERPCGSQVDEDEFDELKNIVCDASLEVYGKVPSERSGSTDANYPLSLGIPAVCIGACVHHGCHTREETVEKDSLYPGMRYLLSVMNSVFYPCQPET